MTPEPSDVTASRSASVQSTAATLLLIAALVVGVYGVSASSLPALLGAAIIGAVAVVLLPRNALPTVALWLLVLFPGGYIYGVPEVIGRYMTPAVLVIAIWLIELAFAQRMTLLLRSPIRGWMVLSPLIVLLFISALFSVERQRTIAWVGVFIVCVVAPAVVGQVSIDEVWPKVRQALAGVGFFLGIVAATDFLFHYNPWRSWYIYDDSGQAIFRTSTSLGHPLTTALVASVALAACVFPSGNTRQWPYWICALGASVALILTVSRTSVIAVGLPVVVGLLSARPHTNKLGMQGRGRLAPLLLAGTFFAAVALSPLLSSRNASQDGIQSAMYRSQVVDIATGLIRDRPILGSGPGTSGQVYVSPSADGLENSALQLLVSIGVPAFACFLTGLGLVIAAAMTRSRPSVAAGITAFAISATGYNVADSNPAMFALLAPLIVCAVMPRTKQVVLIAGGETNKDDGRMRRRSKVAR